MSKALLAAIATLSALTASVTPALATEASGITPSGVNTASESSTTYQDIVKNLYLNYFATAHGTPLSKLDSPYTLDHNGNNTKSSFNTVNFDSDVTAAYMLTKDVGLGLSIPFLLVPVQGQGLVLGNVAIKTFDKHLVSYNGLNISGNLYIQAPSGKADKNRGMDVGLKSTPGIRYQIPNSRFAIGSWNEAKLYEGAVMGKTFKLYTLPYVNYTLTPSLSLNLGYEFETDHMKNDAFFNFTTYETDLQPGVVWFMTPKVMVNPYLQIFTGRKITSDTMALGAVISATVL
jgi:hypothetical protein